jgi:TalC/MipB family fructose-6-phosphate aldolase
MQVFLDSANPEEIKEASKLPFLSGVTTNPGLIARSTGKNLLTEKEFLHFLEEISLVPGEIFVQTNAVSSEGMIEEAKMVYRHTKSPSIIKIPATGEGLKAIKELEEEGVPTAATAVYTVLQGALALSCGARYIIPYYSRMVNYAIDGLDRVTQLLKICITEGDESRLLVASVKSLADVENLLLIGVGAFTLSFDLIKKLSFSEHTEEAVKEFSSLLTVKK